MRLAMYVGKPCPQGVHSDPAEGAVQGEVQIDFYSHLSENRRVLKLFKPIPCTYSVDIFLMTLTYTHYLLINRKFEGTDFSHYKSKRFQCPLPVSRQGKLCHPKEKLGESLPAPHPSNSRRLQKRRNIKTRKKLSQPYSVTNPA